MRVFNIISAISLFLALLAAPVRAEIVWDTPPVSCAVAESPFAVGWLAAKPQPNGRPLIAIVIDDMGVDKRRSAAVIGLPAPLTLAYLPYPAHIQRQVDAGRAAGHAIMLHMPMQASQSTVDPGPNVLRTDVEPSELTRRLRANLDAFTGYDGVNNHMGSRFTQNRVGMDSLMAELYTRELFFLDSATHPASVGVAAAIAAEVPAVRRDIFIDHVENSTAIAQALAATERHARKTGAAIAIGHPKDLTVTALAAWLPTLRAKGFEVVSVATLIQHRQAQVMQAIAPP